MFRPRCIAAYAMLVQPEASIRLRSVTMGPGQGYGFGLFARCDLPANYVIWEAIGMVPGDNLTAHSSLSCIKTCQGQNQRPGSERILYGPLRLVNHRCRTFNAEVRLLPPLSSSHMTNPMH
jgi:hypothetical protein